MALARLTTALDDGLLTLPAGRIGVLRPPIGYDLTALDRESIWIEHGFAPTHAFWAASGYDLGPQPENLSAIIVVLPRSKALARSMIARASTMAELVIIDGQRTEGVDSIYKDLRKRCGDMPTVTKAHGRLFWSDSLAGLEEWFASSSTLPDTSFVTQPGVFSENRIDKGSALLRAALPRSLQGRIADLGAGWGYLSAEILASNDAIAHVDLVEAEALALDCARLNVTDPRAAFHWADALTWQPDGQYDAVVMNPPFHTGRKGDPDLGKGFIATTARILGPTGHVWMVANRHLPYEATLSECFARVEEIGGDGSYKLLHAHRRKK